MVQCLHQCNDYIKRKLGLWRFQKCIPLVGAISAQSCAGPQNTPTHVKRYRAEYGILGKSGATIRHGAVFTLNQWLYQKEARGMESPKMYSFHRCTKRTYLYGSANHPDSCKAVQGRVRNIGKIRGYLSPWYSVCIKDMITSKRSSPYGESKHVFLSSVQ